MGTVVIHTERRIQCIQILRLSMSSLTYLKYCGHGFGEDTPAQKGERLSVARDMEEHVKGYKVLRKEMVELRALKVQQENLRYRSGMEKCIKTKFYKSLQGIRTAKSSGGIYFTEPVARVGIFSA